MTAAEAFGLSVVVLFVYVAWRVADYFGAHFAWLPW